MKLIFTIIMTTFSMNAPAKPFDLESYAAPQLYYSKQGIHERQEQELQKQSNEIAKQRLEFEKEQLQIQQEQLEIQKESIENQ